MSNTASLENSKRLYELSKWHTGSVTEEEWSDPQYTAGYLLRKLPSSTSVNKSSVGYSARHRTFDENVNVPRLKTAMPARFEVKADTPEDALALLAIKLFEEGILTKESS